MKDKGWKKKMKGKTKTGRKKIVQRKVARQACECVRVCACDGFLQNHLAIIKGTENCRGIRVLRRTSEREGTKTMSCCREASVHMRGE